MAIEDLMGEGTVLPITRWGTPVMHEQTQPVTAFDDDLRTLVADMFTTMRAAQGVGLAATQVGRGLSLFVYLCPDADDFVHYGAICNPPSPPRPAKSATSIPPTRAASRSPVATNASPVPTGPPAPASTRGANLSPSREPASWLAASNTRPITSKARSSATACPPAPTGSSPSRWTPSRTSTPTTGP